MMSVGNVELVRRWVEAVLRWLGSSAGPDELSTAMADLLHSELDYSPVRKFPDAAPTQGREEYVRFIARFREAWSYDVEVKQLIPVGDDRVLLGGMLRAEGRASRIELADELYQCFWLRDGLIVRLEDHVTLKGALRALGLSGETLDAAGLQPWA
jgi:hypothetical protein